MRKPLPPLQAFAADAESAAGRAVDLGPQLMHWLTVAQAAESLASSGTAVTPSALAQTSALLGELHGGRPSMTHDVRPAPDDPLGLVAESLRATAEAMELAGCFEMAFTTVAAVCRLASHGDYVTASIATAHLGRIARQMNDFDTAEDCYTTVVDRGTRERDGPIRARGHIGLALLSDMRGNFPSAETHYHRALASAVPGKRTYVDACQGLMSLAIAGNQLGDALLYGWKICDTTEDDDNERASAVSELALVALRAGFPDAALHGFEHALRITTMPRVRVVALSGAIRAAASVGDRPRVKRFHDAIERSAAVVNQPFITSHVLLSVAEALHDVGDTADAGQALSRVRTLALQHGFHEHEFSADQLERSWRAAERTSRRQDTAGASTWSDAGEQETIVREGITRLAALR
jgi:tetratricopeptide (TPR) repeat protein